MSDIATFVSRDCCLGCYSRSLRVLSYASERKEIGGATWAATREQSRPAVALKP